MAEIPKHVEASIFQRVQADLEPSSLVVYGKVGQAVTSGGLISLLLCGQFGVAGSQFAMQLNQYFHQSGGLVCGVICGAFFALAPLAVLRLQCSAMQFHVILKKRYHAALVWFAFFGGALALNGNLGNEFSAVFAWFVAAMIVFESGGMLMRYAESAVFNRRSRVF